MLQKRAAKDLKSFLNAFAEPVANAQPLLDRLLVIALKQAL
jgi:hypothetical protein